MTQEYSTGDPSIQKGKIINIKTMIITECPVCKEINKDVINDFLFFPNILCKKCIDIYCIDNIEFNEKL